MNKTMFSSEYTNFRGTLKDLRLRASVTQSDFEIRLVRPQSHVSKFEAGERHLDVVEAMVVCEAIGIPFEERALADTILLLN